jgi:hypothetical protein
MTAAVEQADQQQEGWHCPQGHDDAERALLEPSVARSCRSATLSYAARRSPKWDIRRRLRC